MKSTTESTENTKGKKTGVELIAMERQRQIGAEGWTAQHDDTHTQGEISAAALCYTMVGCFQAAQPSVRASLCPSFTQWPFEPAAWKPSDDVIKNLVRAGALIAAEIDRIQRKQEGGAGQ